MENWKGLPLGNGSDDDEKKFQNEKKNFCRWSLSELRNTVGLQYGMRNVAPFVH